MRLVAVDGPSGSGKTTFAGELARALGAGLLSTDDFATWDDPVAWWPRVAAGVLDPLRRSEPGRYRRMVWTSGEPVLGPEVVVEVPDVLVLEGVSSGRRAVSALLTHLVWCEAPDPAERLRRVLDRDGQPSETHFRRWQQFETGWFAVDGTRQRADSVFTS
ncbi:uridine kinase family protein [Actinokineospora pegani]|uniref:uridine kinase family protein n=1 Tax=Actinokineospora pegani TaxID=2654637 RepID=UPI0012EA594E|nr:AAA family ATPase [Actinokineospora pegani]